MAVIAKHAYTAVGTDAGNGEVNKARWNADHTVLGAVEIFATSGAAQTVPATTTETVLATITIPGGAMGPNGQVWVFSQWSLNNNANFKNSIIRVGGVAGTAMTDIGSSTYAGTAKLTIISNSNSQSAQKCIIPAGNATGFGQFTSAGTTATVNTAANWDLVIAGRKGNSADTLVLESYSVLILYGA